MFFHEIFFDAGSTVWLLFFEMFDVISVFLALVALSGGRLREVRSESAESIAVYDASAVNEINAAGAFESNHYGGMCFGSEVVGVAYPDMYLYYFNFWVVSVQRRSQFDTSCSEVFADDGSDTVDYKL